MKKYIALAAATAILIAGIIFSGNTIIGSVPFVSVYKAEPSKIEETVVCTGKIEYRESRDVHAVAGGIIEKLYIKKGDKVNAGDKLCDLLLTASSNGSGSDIPNTQEIYQAVLNGNYSVLDNYDELLESAAKAQKGTGATASQTITAPISGTIEEIGYSENEYASPGDIVLSIVSDGDLQVVLPVSEVKINDIKIGQDVRITGSGFKNSIYNGKVTSIDDEAKQTTTTSGKETTVNVTVSIENPKDDIKTGYSAKCSIVSSVKTDALVLPYQAVKADNDGKEFVYLYNSGIASKKYIKTDGEYPDGLEVVKGVKYNDYVITNPDIVRDKSTVKLTAADGNGKAVVSNA